MEHEPRKAAGNLLVEVVGTGMAPDDLTDAHRRLIAEADLLAGGRRHLAWFPACTCETFEITADLPALVDRLRRRAGRRIVVLASGDPLYYGIGAYLANTLGPDQIRVHPNVTSVAAAFARMGEPWQGAAVVSLHGRDQTADLDRALRAATRVAVFTDSRHTPDWVGGFLRGRGYDGVRIGVFERMGTDQERISWHTPAGIAGRTFGAPNMVVLKNAPVDTGDRRALHLGLAENDFIHDGGLITKTEIRAVSLARLNLMPQQVLWDLGAGSGAVAIEASLLMPGGRIWAVEKDPRRVGQIRANRDRFGAGGLEVVEAVLPSGLDALPDPDRVFIGGGGSALAEIVARVCRRLAGSGIVVINTVLLDSLHDAVQCLEAGGMRVDVSQVQVSRSRPLAGSERLEALNPVWIIRGVKIS